MKIVKIILTILSISILLLIITVLFLKYYPSGKNVNFKVNITDIYLCKEPNSIDCGYYILHGRDAEDFRENPDNYATIRYGITYFSDKDFHEKLVSSMSVFFDVEYPNILNDLMINHTRLKDFGFGYVSGQIYTYGVSVTVKRSGYSEEQIFEMAKEVKIKVTAIDDFDMSEMMIRK